MDKIKEIAVIICISSVAVSFLTFLAPEGSLRKPFNTVVSLVMIFVFIGFVADVGSIDEMSREIILPDIKQEEEYSVYLNEYIYDMKCEIIKEEIGEIIEKLCNEKFLYEVVFTSDNEMNVHIDKIQIYICENDITNKQRIIYEIISQTGVTPAVGIYNE